MRKRFGCPIVVEFRCGADNGACGQLDVDCVVIVAPDGPRWCTQRNGAEVHRIHPNHVKRARAERQGRYVPRDGPIDDQNTGTPLDAIGQSWVRCPLHGRGIVDVDEVRRKYAEYQRTRRVQQVSFIPGSRLGHIWIGTKLVPVDAEWWNAQDDATRKKWAERRSGG